MLVREASDQPLLLPGEVRVIACTDSTDVRLDRHVRHATCNLRAHSRACGMSDVAACARTSSSVELLLPRCALTTVTTVYIDRADGVCCCMQRGTVSRSHLRRSGRAVVDVVVDTHATTVCVGVRVSESCAARGLARLPSAVLDLEKKNAVRSIHPVESVRPAPLSALLRN
jgi:hypothetical protein